MPKASEVGILIVGGQMFEDWESVFVQHRWQEGWPTFRFTASERANLPADWMKAQFKPGTRCQIVLGGQLAITGIILQRQVSYDATQHSVQLSGVGEQWAGASSTIDSANGNNNFDGLNIEGVFNKATAPYGLKVKVIGKPDTTLFDALQSHPGELVFDFLDRASRMAMARVGSDHLGNLLLIADHSNPIVQSLVEGENILKMQCVFSNEMMSTLFKVPAQQRVKDEDAFRKSTEQAAIARSAFMKEVYKFTEIPSEQNVSMDKLQKRADYEAQQRDATQVV